MNALKNVSMALTVVTALTGSCTRTAPVSDPVSGSRKSANSKSLKAATESEQKAVATVNTTAKDQTAAPQSAPASAAVDAPKIESNEPTKESPILDDCDTTARFTDGEPVFLPETKVVITRIMSSCRDKSGAPGHRKNAGWMAMGFPCTGGEGRIDWKGTNYNRPKMVSFLLETSCQMGPKDHNLIKKEAEKVAGITGASPMIAFNPFVIQYWEVPGYEDADTSFTVDLRSGKGLDDAWIKFIKPKPLKIFLVGRENAWVPGNYMYAVEAELNWASKNRFTMKVDTARKLSGDELSKVRGRCEALRPERECGRVF